VAHTATGEDAFASTTVSVLQACTLDSAPQGGRRTYDKFERGRRRPIFNRSLHAHSAAGFLEPATMCLPILSDSTGRARFSYVTLGGHWPKRALHRRRAEMNPSRWLRLATATFWRARQGAVDTGLHTLMFKRFARVTVTCPCTYSDQRAFSEYFAARCTVLIVRGSTTTQL